MLRKTCSSNILIRGSFSSSRCYVGMCQVVRWSSVMWTGVRWSGVMWSSGQVSGGQVLCGQVSSVMWTGGQVLCGHVSKCHVLCGQVSSVMWACVRWAGWTSSDKETANIFQAAVFSYFRLLRPLKSIFKELLPDGLRMLITTYRGHYPSKIVVLGGRRYLPLY